MNMSRDRRFTQISTNHFLRRSLTPQVCSLRQGHRIFLGCLSPNLCIGSKRQSRISCVTNQLSLPDLCLVLHHLLLYFTVMCAKSASDQRLLWSLLKQQNATLWGSFDAVFYAKEWTNKHIPSDGQVAMLLDHIPPSRCTSKVHFHVWTNSVMF